jgi:hypothetical protein
LINIKLAFLNYNGCLNPPNFSIDYNLQNYSISFWIKLDRQNEFCSSDATKKYYFLAYPHSLYNDFSSSNDRTNFGYKMYYQLLTNSNTKILISNFSQYNWNHIQIEFNSISKTFKLIINYNYFTPEITIENVSSLRTMIFTKLIFCPNNNNCNISPAQFLINSNEKFIWGSAFYRSLSIDDSLNSNLLISQEKLFYK